MAKLIEPELAGGQLSVIDKKWSIKDTFLVVLISAVGSILRFHEAIGTNIVHPDEIFQSIEPAHRLAFGYGVITWEWREGIRSWVLPGILALFMRAAAAIHNSAETYTYAISLVLAVLSSSTVWFGYLVQKEMGGSRQACFLTASLAAFWCDLVVLGSRALNEVIATDVLLPGIYCALYGRDIRGSLRWIIVGISFVSACCFRIQLLPTIAILALVFILPFWRKRAAFFLCGCLIPIICFGTVDCYTWSYPFQSIIKYVDINLLQNKSAEYGTAPPIWYLEVIAIRFWPLLPFAVWGIWKNPILGATALSILCCHSFVSHKEWRFLYPLMPLLVTLAGIGSAELIDVLSSHKKYASHTLTSLTLAALMLASYSRWASFPFWENSSGALSAFDQLSKDQSICGVGIYETRGFDTGGYSHLHQAIPIMIESSLQEIVTDGSAVNAIVTPANLEGVLPSFARESCWGAVCIYKRQGNCRTPIHDREINQYLQRLGR